MWVGGSYAAAKAIGSGALSGVPCGIPSNIPIKFLNPGATMNIGTPEWLTQIQHKVNRIETVDHADHSKMPVHFVSRFRSDGTIDFEWQPLTP